MTFLFTMLSMANHVFSDPKQRIELIKEKCASLSRAIEDNKEALTQELLKCESFETATDEIWRSLDCLENISKEFEDLSYGKVSLLCTFFPVNLPLYSLVIFAIVPGFMAEEVVVRPPKLMFEVVENIWKVLGLSKLLPHIKFVDLERSLFREAYVSIADVVLFTGRYENAKVIQEACPDALFIYNGAGINPVLITESANIDLAVEKTTEMRIFNSGQDCAGSDAVLVHEKIANEFCKKLVTKIKDIKVGDYADREVRVGRLVKVDQIDTIEKFFAENSKKIIFGGKIDKDAGIVYPTVIKDDIRNISEITYTEFFAPVFYLLVYHDEDDLQRYFADGYTDGAMYISLFSADKNAASIPNSIVLLDQIVNDVERGNNPYGGYGPKANFVSYHGIYHYRPILISKEICEYLHEINSAQD